MKEPLAKWVAINKVKENPENPRTITEEELDRLVESLKTFPKMIEYRPILADPKTGYIIGGNQRHKAATRLGWEKVPVVYIEDEFSKEKLKEIMLKDNLDYGEWDFDIVKNEFEKDDLISWGLEDAKYLSFEQDFDLDGHEEDYEDYEEHEDYEENQIKRIVFNLNDRDYKEALDFITQLVENGEINNASDFLIQALEK